MSEGEGSLVLPRYDLSLTDADGRRSRVQHDCIPNNPDVDPEHEPPPPALERRLGGVTDLSELEEVLLNKNELLTIMAALRYKNGKGKRFKGKRKS